MKFQFICFTPKLLLIKQSTFNQNGGVLGNTKIRNMHVAGRKVMVRTNLGKNRVDQKRKYCTENTLKLSILELLQMYTVLCKVFVTGYYVHGSVGCRALETHRNSSGNRRSQVLRLFFYMRLILVCSLSLHIVPARVNSELCRMHSKK